MSNPSMKMLKHVLNPETQSPKPAAGANESSTKKRDTLTSKHMNKLLENAINKSGEGRSLMGSKNHSFLGPARQPVSESFTDQSFDREARGSPGPRRDALPDHPNPQDGSGTKPKKKRQNLNTSQGYEAHIAMNLERPRGADLKYHKPDLPNESADDHNIRSRQKLKLDMKPPLLHAQNRFVCLDSVMKEVKKGPLFSLPKGESEVILKKPIRPEPNALAQSSSKTRHALDTSTSSPGLDESRRAEPQTAASSFKKEAGKAGARQKFFQSEKCLASRAPLPDYYMGELLQSAGKGSPDSPFLKHFHINYQLYNKLKTSKFSQAAPKPINLADASDPRVLIKTASPRKPLTLLFDLDETLIHCDVGSLEPTNSTAEKKVGGS